MHADLAQGEGLPAAVAGTDVVIHAATTAWVGPNYLHFKHLFRHPGSVDVEGTRRLIEEAIAAKVDHMIYISIVGIDHFSQLGYFRNKLEAERLVSASGLPWTIVRSTQFFQFIDMAMLHVSPLPMLPLPTDFPGQAIDPDDMAARIVDVAQDGPENKTLEIGGPEILSFGEMARLWLAANKLRRPILHLPMPGAIASKFRRGLATCPAHRHGSTTWASWLDRRYGSSLAASV